MSINFDNNKIQGLYLGDEKIGEVWAGDQLIYPEYPSGTYVKQLYYNPSADGSGSLSDSMYNYDLLRITTMPSDPVTNKLAAPNAPFYIDPETLKTRTVHTQTFGYDNASAVNVSGWFIWGDNEFVASEDGMSFSTRRHGPNFRVGGTRWNTTTIPANGDSATYQNYLNSIYMIEGINYNKNRELLYSGASPSDSVNLSKSITGQNYKYIQIKHSVNNTNNFDGDYISQINATRMNTRDSISTPYGLNGNWYNGSTVLQWSNNYQTLSCMSAKSFKKSLNESTSMSGDYTMPKSNILAVWGVK